MHGLGIDYRYTTDFGLITKIGVGKVLNGWQAEDTSDEYVYKSSKLFTNFSVEYQLGIGITFGIYATFSPEMTFDRYLPGIHSEPFIDSEELIFQNESKSQFVNFGVSIGYAVPWKNKRKKRNKI